MGRDVKLQTAPATPLVSEEAECLMLDLHGGAKRRDGAERLMNAVSVSMVLLVRYQTEFTFRTARLRRWKVQSQDLACLGSSSADLTARVCASGREEPCMRLTRLAINGEHRESHLRRRDTV